MGTQSGAQAPKLRKRKKFSLSKLATIILALLPRIVDILNDEDDSNIVSIGIAADPESGSIKTRVSKGSVTA